ncbi:MAG: Flp pilus assembly complex ATPase component TadA [Candidatus Omnitrophica bacterium]|nr:Flp pilus assembly complex ATPase component TadA [Candidatus Omnitrophota bacterium]
MIKIGKLLQDAGLVTAADIDKAIAEQKKSGKFLGTILVAMGKITEADLLRCLSQQMRIDFIELKDTRIPPEITSKVPVKYVWHYKVMPVKYDPAKNVLSVAISDPLNMWPLEDMKLHLGMEIDPVLATTADIDETIKKHYGVGADTIDKILTKEEDKKTAEVVSVKKVQDIEKLAGDASVIKLVNEILKEAIESRATDVHFESYENELVVRYRVDGVLQPTKVSDDIKFLYSAIIARIKVMSGLDIVERRLPQSGAARIRMGNREYDLRTSIIPDNYGEGVVIRILPSEMLVDLGQLGVPPKELELLNSFIERSHGIIYVTGPTGSGKTTTLYACLSKLNKPGVKIVTVEDPIEYKMRYIEQFQVNAKIGLTFSAILRSVLRHDPDIIMVGEVRDAETAQIAVQASLTGHLVLSTLHTNDAPSAVTRLLDMGVEPYLVSSSVIALVAQRLVRKVCTHCRKEVQWKNDALPPALQAALRHKTDKVMSAKGCEKCRMTGYQGRIAIYEILPVSAAIQALVMKKVSAAEIRQKGIEEGMKTLFQSGWEHVCEGLTTPEEVLRVVQEQV